MTKRDLVSGNAVRNIQERGGKVEVSNDRCEVLLPTSMSPLNMVRASGSAQHLYGDAGTQCEYRETSDGIKIEATPLYALRLTAFARNGEQTKKVEFWVRLLETTQIFSYQGGTARHFLAVSGLSVEPYEPSLENCMKAREAIRHAIDRRWLRLDITDPSQLD